MSIAYKTKTDVVREKLRKDILEGRIKPGCRIIISEMAKEFGLSEIPVREAIRRLESEGLVQYTPHVGAAVSIIDENEFFEIYLIRIELEVLATRLAVPHIGHRALSRLKTLISRAEAAVGQGMHEKLGPLNKDFHLSIYQAGPYAHLYKMIVDLWDKFEFSNRVFSYVPDRAAGSWEEHLRILKAIESGDADTAAELVRMQKHRTKKALEQSLAKSAGRVSGKIEPVDPVGIRNA
jgi:DNA-binding GntR family transcriptional regulator